MSYLGFPKILLSSLVCQKDGSVLMPSDSVDDFVMDSTLSCSNCRSKYLIKDGIFDAQTIDNSLEDVLLQEILERDKNAVYYDERLAPRYYKEVLPTLKEFSGITNKKIIEYGCGTGRFTKILSNKNNVLAVDFSRESLMLLASNLKSNNQVGLVLADATNFISKDGFFDIAFSAQFLEHIPTMSLRSRFFDLMRKTLKLRGLFVITVYHQDLRRSIKKELPEGFHSNGIFFHYFSRKELVSELQFFFKVHQVSYLDITLPLEYRFHLLPRVGGLISEFFSKLPIFRKLGHLILVKGYKE